MAQAQVSRSMPVGAVHARWHALGAHGVAIIATVILGALIGRYLGNRSCTSAADVPKRLHRSTLMRKRHTSHG